MYASVCMYNNLPNNYKIEKYIIYSHPTYSWDKVSDIYKQRSFENHIYIDTKSF